MESSDISPEFHVDLLFPDQYSDFIAEVYYRNRLVFGVSQELGSDEFEIEFAPDLRGLPDRMSLKGLEGATDYAKRRLKELRKKK